MPLERIVLSAKARDQLITLKRRTGIENWNVLCRWAFCVSLREKNPLPDANHPSDSNLEMSWKTFGGELSDVYWALTKQKCIQDGIDPRNEDAVAHQFRLHLHRGIRYLAAGTTGSGKTIQTVADLIKLAC